MPDTVLVTGGAGYIGSHIVVELARAGYAPVVLDNFANSTPAIVARLESLAGRPVPSIAADVRDIVNVAILATVDAQYQSSHPLPSSVDR